MSNNPKKARFFEVEQAIYHPDHLERTESGQLTGNLLPEFVNDEPLITEQIAIDACANHATIKKAAIFLHSKDVWNAEDEKKNPKHKCGWDKPDHLHIYLHVQPDMSPSTIAKWFGVEPQYVEIKTGRGAFEDCLEYGFHESPSAIEAQKYHYDEEAVVYAKNCNPREVVDKLQSRLAVLGSSGRNMSPADELRYKVQQEGMTLREAERHDPITFGKIQTQLKRLRGWYLSNHAPLPPLRTCFYVSGKGGIGKGILCRALARSLTAGIEDEQAAIFTAGGAGVAFQEYDGQPVVIFNDRRAIDFITEFGSRQAVYDMFDPTPTNTQYNIKYGSVTLTNSIVIINGIDDYETFLNGLAGEYTDKQGQHFKAEDKSQIYRRFSFIIEVREEDLDVRLNKGIMNGTREYCQYVRYANLRANMRRMKEQLGEISDESIRVQHQICAPIVEKHLELEQKRLPASTVDVSEFEDYGKMLTKEESIALRFKTCDRDCTACEFREEERRGGTLLSINKNPYCREQLEKQVAKSSND